MMPGKSQHWQISLANVFALITSLSFWLALGRLVGFDVFWEFVVGLVIFAVTLIGFVGVAVMGVVTDVQGRKQFWAVWDRMVMERDELDTDGPFAAQLPEFLHKRSETTK